MNETGSSGATILVADNDEAVTRALTIRLEQAGYRCLAANSGAQALSLFQRNPADLIITDLNMPCGGGLALIQTVRQTSDVPIIVVTGFSDEMRAGVKGMGTVVLRKPFEMQAVLDLIELELADTQRRAA